MAPFHPAPDQELNINGDVYHVTEHPNAPGVPYGQEGRQAIVYQLRAGDELRALKVFKPRYSTPSLVTLAEHIARYASLPGLQVCKRIVLTSRHHRALLREHPSLIYAVLMPWVEGPTWQEMLNQKRELTPQQSLDIARSLAEMLVSMEERGIAHCDISGANLILTPDFSQPIAALVDVEGVYTSDLSKPELLPAGSPGYAHKTAPHSQWSMTADRFSGAVTLAEILGWCIPEVREVAWGENFFDVQEMQKDSKRYQTLVAALELTWGSDLANLFTGVWQSDTLADCPTLGKWLVAMPDEAPEQIDNYSPPELTGASADLEATRLILTADRAAESGEFDKAISLYQEAIVLLPSDFSQDIEKRILAVKREIAHAQSMKCPNCGRRMARDLSACPHCEREIETVKAEEKPAPAVQRESKQKKVIYKRERVEKRTQPRRKNRIPIWGWTLLGVVIIIVLVFLFINIGTQPPTPGTVTSITLASETPGTEAEIYISETEGRIEHRGPDEPGFRSVSENGAVNAAPGTVIRLVGEGRLRLELPDGSLIFLSSNTEIELQQFAGQLASVIETHLIIRQGLILIVTNLEPGFSFAVSTEGGDRATVTGSMMGVRHIAEAGNPLLRFELDCLEGHCVLRNQNGVQQELSSGQFSWLVGEEGPKEVGGIRCELYDTLGDPGMVDCPPTPTVTVTLTATLTLAPTLTPTPTEIFNTPTLLPPTTEPTNTKRPGSCTLNLSGNNNIDVGNISKYTAKVNLTGNASLTSVKFSVSPGGILSLSTNNDTTAPYTTNALAIGAGSATITAKATLQGGGSCQGNKNVSVSSPAMHIWPVEDNNLIIRSHIIGGAKQIELRLEVVY